MLLDLRIRDGEVHALVDRESVRMVYEGETPADAERVRLEFDSVTSQHLIRKLRNDERGPVDGAVPPR